MNVTTVKSPAKINLYLNILGKLKNGYHSIETVFERVSLFDEIILKKLKKRGITLECNAPQMPTGSKNLAYKAASEFLKRTNKKIGLHIKINKRIPVSGGLGGGSSNAASVLLGLNRLLKMRLNTKQLIQIGSKLGSDVPFFILNRTNAIGTKRGDVLTAIDTKKTRYYILVNPNLRISTADTYNKMKLGLTGKRGSVKIWIRLLKKDSNTLSKHLYNSLERVVLDRYPILKYIKSLLLSYGVRGCLVSGSGGTVFGLVNSRKEAMPIRDKILGKHPDWRVEIVKSY